MRGFTEINLFLAVVLLIKFATGTTLNLKDELRSSVDLSTLYRSSIFSEPSSGLVVQKCCPFGKSFPGISRNYSCIASDFGLNGMVNNNGPVENHIALSLQPIERKLCGGDIEIIIGNEADENLWISKHGYLLLTDKNFPDISIYKRYCVERNGSRVLARVCYSREKPPEWVFTEKIIPVCMLISVPLLFATALIYLIIPKLRTVHGETLVLYTVCLAIGYLLMAYDKLASSADSHGIQTGIHFFMLSSCCWLLMMTFDMAYHVWSYHPLPHGFQRTILLRLGIYILIAFGVPALIVVTIHSDLSENGRAENALIPIMIPISIIILLNFLSFIPIYKYYTKSTPRCTEKEEVKHRAKSVAWILTIIAANWMFEMVGMLWQNMRLSLIAFPTLDALQGVVMICVFVLMPHYKKIICKWWGKTKYSRPEDTDEEDQV